MRVLPSLPALPSVPRLLPRIEAALDAVVALEQALRTLPDEVRGLRKELSVLAEVSDEMRGMRGDIGDVIRAVEGLQAEIGRLPPDVVHLRGTVDDMYGAVGRLEGQVVGLEASLQKIDRIAARVVNPLRRRTPE